MVSALVWFPGSNKSSCIPLYCSGVRVGLIKPNVLESLICYPHVFEVVQREGDIERVQIAGDLKDVQERTAALNTVFAELRDKGAFPCLKGWRNEVCTCICVCPCLPIPCVCVCTCICVCPCLPIHCVRVCILGLLYKMNNYIVIQLFYLCLQTSRTILCRKCLAVPSCSTVREQLPVSTEQQYNHCVPIIL